MWRPEFFSVSLVTNIFDTLPQMWKKTFFNIRIRLTCIFVRIFYLKRRKYYSMLKFSAFYRRTPFKNSFSYFNTKLSEWFGILMFLFVKCRCAWHFFRFNCRFVMKYIDVKRMLSIFLTCLDFVAKLSN